MANTRTHIMNVTPQTCAAALDLADHVMRSPDCFKPSRECAVDLAHTVVVLVHALSSTADGILPGDVFRMSVKLLQDLHDMPAHESVTVRLVRTELGADGVGVLVLQMADELVAH